MLPDQEVNISSIVFQKMYKHWKCSWHFLSSSDGHFAFQLDSVFLETHSTLTIGMAKLSVESDADDMLGADDKLESDGNSVFVFQSGDHQNEEMTLRSSVLWIRWHCVTCDMQGDLDEFAFTIHRFSTGISLCHIDRLTLV